MATTRSKRLPLGSPAPDFALEDTHGKRVARDDLAGAPTLLVAFICNHCPFVKHIQLGLAQLGRDYHDSGLAMVAINPNDADRYPDDSPENMAREAKRAGYVFPYLYDATQEVALAYGVACTPEFYLFDAGRNLVYRGRFDGATPGNAEPVTGADLRRALDAVLSEQRVPSDQIPSVGCSIKWRPGNEPE